MNTLALVIAFGGSAILSALCVALSIVAARRWNMYDHPDMERKTQERPIPKLGGVAVALVFLVATTLVLFGSGRSNLVAPALGILLPALGAALVGFFDDRRHLNPYLRLGLQAALATVAWAMGTRLELFGFAPLNYVVFVLWVMTIVNGINLLDNSDGLAGSTAMICAMGAGVVALISGQTLVSVMAFALAGAALGFLWHNWHPAKVYLGDAGAYFLGFMLAVLVVRVKPEGMPVWLGVAIAVLLTLLPLLDTSYVTVKRLRAGVHPFTAGRDHLSHVLQDRGATVAKSVTQLQMISVTSSLLAVSLAVFAS